LITSINPTSYFPLLKSTLVPSTQLNPKKKKKHYTFAYLVMVHDEADMSNIQFLINLLDDGSAILLIHVDKSADTLHAQLKAWLRERASKKKRSSERVHLAKNRIKGMWGHFSLVLMELSGFWELLDLAEWDYILNFSSMDLPLISSRELIKTIRSKNKMGIRTFIYSYQSGKSPPPSHIYVFFWFLKNPVDEISLRMHYPYLKDTKAHPRKNGNLLRLPESISPPLPAWKLRKQFQWMILPRDFVEFTRYSEEGLFWLAVTEWIRAGDESYFITGIKNFFRLNIF
jgi:hypothetical protein